ncbi:MAG: amidase [Azospirillaceae bacterium]
MADGAATIARLAGFEPDAGALCRYGGLIADTIERVSAAAAALPDEAEPEPLAPGRPPVTAPAPGPPVERPGYEHRGIGDLVDTVHDLLTGTTRPSALVEAAIDAVNARDAELGAIVALEAGPARARARELDRRRAADRGAMAGAPYARKDLFYRAGRPAECGAAMRAGHVPEVTASVLGRLDGANGIDIGRLAMAEFAMSPTGLNAHTAHPRNPWSADHVPGGSSSGSAIAVAAGYVPLALGTDTGGSVRHPAAMCGLTGLKPTAGRIGRGGVWPLSSTLDCVGPIARSARDCALALQILAGADPADPTAAPVGFAAPDLTGDLSGVTVAVPGGYYAEQVSPSVAAALDRVKDHLAEAGARLVATAPPDMALVNALAHLVLSVEASSRLGPEFAARGPAIGRQVRDRLEPGLAYPATLYANALRLRRPVREAWLAACIGEADLALIPAIPREVPTIAETTAPHPADDPEAVAAVIGHVTRATRGINYLGLPALVAPCGRDDAGLPIAFQLVGRPFDEARLISVADAFQRHDDSHTRRPPLAR